MRMCRQHILAPALLPDSSQPVFLCQSLEQLRLFWHIDAQDGNAQSQSLIYNTKKESAKADSSLVEMVETKGIEPSTSRMRTERSPS